jgi:hypothetical protein
MQNLRKTEEKRPLGRPKCRWKDNIKIDHKELYIKVSRIYLVYYGD